MLCLVFIRVQLPFLGKNIPHLKKTSSINAKDNPSDVSSNTNTSNLRFVIPAKAGIQKIILFLRRKFNELDTGLRRYDGTERLF